MIGAFILKVLLSGDTDIAELVGMRVYPDAPPKDAPVPCIVYMVSEIETAYAKGQPISDDYRVEIAWMSASATERDRMLELVKDRFHRAAGDVPHAPGRRVKDSVVVGGGTEYEEEFGKYLGRLAVKLTILYP